MTLTYNQIAARGLERIAALSDGLFAIAMTLIVLEIRIPDPGPISTEQELWAAIVALGPRFVTYLLSFLTLGIFWGGQQTQLNHFARADRQLAWLSLAFLAVVAIMPFSTSLLAEFITYRLALGIYWLNILALGVVWYATWIYATRAGLVRDGTTPEVGRAIKRRFVVAQSLYALGALLGLLSTYLGIAFIVLVQLNFAVAPRARWLSRF
jgi:uncharacterized membrane protein